MNTKIWFQPRVTLIMEGIVDLHNYIFGFLILVYLVLLFLYLYYIGVSFLKKKILCLCLSSPLVDQETLSALITLSKQSISLATMVGTLYNRRLIMPIGTVKGYDFFMTFGGLGISKTYFSVLNANAAVYLGGDGKDTFGFWFTYGAVPKSTFKMNQESFLYELLNSLKSERDEVLRRVYILEGKLLDSNISEEERAASFISNEVYLRRLSDNKESIVLLRSYLKKREEFSPSPSLVLELNLPRALGYSPQGGLGVSYNEHFLEVCLENRELYNGAFRRFWQGRDCQHHHKMDDAGCLTALRAEKFEMFLETLDKNSAIIPYSYNLIKVLEEFREKVGFEVPKLSMEAKAFFEDPKGFYDSGKTLFVPDTKGGELGTIWLNLIKEGALFHDICIQDSLSPESPLDLSASITFRAFGLFFLFGMGYLDNSSSIYFDGLCYKPVEVARDLYNVKRVFSFIEVFKYVKSICLEKEIKYKKVFYGFGLSSLRVKNLSIAFLPFSMQFEVVLSSFFI